MYDEEIVNPVREEIKSLGVEELKTPKEVDNALRKKGSILVLVNSVCGCAGGIFRPGVALALKHRKLPDKTVSVFAGVDMNATERARKYFTGYAPSSPSLGLLKNGKLVFMMERRDIERSTPEKISRDLINAFEEYL